MYFLLKSKKLKKTILNYMQNSLIIDQKLEITRKLYKIVRKWTGLSKDKSHSTFQLVCDNIENNPKFKLPWTLVETEQAARNFCECFNVQNHAT